MRLIRPGVNCSDGVAWTVASRTGVGSPGSPGSVGPVGEEYPPHAPSAAIMNGARSLDAPRKMVRMEVVLLFLVVVLQHFRNGKDHAAQAKIPGGNELMRRAAERIERGQSPDGPF